MSSVGIKAVAIGPLDTLGPENKIESFQLSSNDEYVYAGTVSGSVLIFESRNLQIVGSFHAHAGIIAAVVCHVSQPLLAFMSGDNTISVWNISDPIAPRLLCRIPIHSIVPCNDTTDVADFQSESQAIAFHDEKLRIATRTANGAVLEVDFDSFGNFRYIHCLRLFSDADLTSVRYLPGTAVVMAGSIDGNIKLFNGGEICGDISIPGSGNIHWMEHVRDDEFLIANDTRFIARLKLSKPDEMVIGPKFPRDDLEHIAISHDGRTAYAASFDRNIYRVDPDTCVARDVVFEAPFKCRWVRPVRGNMERLIVQTRDGGLHLVEPERRLAISTIRATPKAIWTADHVSNEVIRFAGEGPIAWDLDVNSLAIDSVSIDGRASDESTYTKRVIHLDDLDITVFGQTDGTLVSRPNIGKSVTRALGSAIRDLSYNRNHGIYVGLEDGRVVRCKPQTLEITAQFKSASEEPVWSIASGDGVIAVAERSGKLLLLDESTLEVESTVASLVRPKRMKWIDKNVLLYVWSDQLHRYDRRSGQTFTLVESIGNTIEDFIVTHELGYIVMVSYMRNLYLARLNNGEILCKAPDGIDYSKGLCWLHPDTSVSMHGAPEFVTYGRHGVLNLYRVYNEKIHFSRSIAF